MELLIAFVTLSAVVIATPGPDTALPSGTRPRVAVAMAP